MWEIKCGIITIKKTTNVRQEVRQAHTTTKMTYIHNTSY